MPGGEDRLRAELERLAKAAHPEGAFEAVAAKKARRRLIHKAQVVGLTVAVVAGTAGGTLALARVFSGGSTERPASQVGNGLIAFARADDVGHSMIYTVRPDGSGLAALPLDTASAPAWSPDGRSLAFVKGAEIYTATSLGGRVVRLTSNAVYDDSPAWSPDGRMIAFTDDRRVGGNGNYQLYVMRSNGKEVRRLTHLGGIDHGSTPSWSPDGSSIAFVEHQTGVAPGCPPNGYCPLVTSLHVDVMSLSGGDPRELTNGTGDRNPSWSPRGDRIVFVRNGDLYLLDSNGTGLSRLTSGSAVDVQPSWSPDGSSIVFVRYASDGHSHIWTIRADGTGLRQVTAGGWNDTHPSWQPVLGGTPQTPIPTVSPTPIQTPSETPSESPSVTPSGSPTPTGSPGEPPNIGFPCDGSEVIADLDGDGLLDRAIVAPTGAIFHNPPAPCPSPTGDTTGIPFSITVAWGSGGQETWDLPQCQAACQAYATQDLEGNGTAEFALLVDQGASTQFMDLYEIPNDHLGPILYEVGPPGTDKYKGFDALKLAFGGSVTHQDFVTCQTGLNGGPQLIATSAQLSPDQTTWNLSETVFDYNGQVFPNDVPPRSAKAFTVASTREYTEPFDPSGNPPTVTGDPCFQPP